MSQLVELIQNKKGKTFAEICPIWNNILEQVIDMPISIDDDRRPRKFLELSRMYNVSITDSRRCVFGEAYEWNNSYERSETDHCRKCVNMIYGVNGIVSIAQFGTRSQLEDFKARFILHFNEVHAK